MKSESSDGDQASTTSTECAVACCSNNLGTTRSIPWGAMLLGYCPPFLRFPNISYKVLILFLTYLCYINYHMTRKAFSTVKAVLAPNCSDGYSNDLVNDSMDFNESYSSSSTYSPDGGWEPFNSGHCKLLLGAVDYSWAFAYAIATFFSGPIADRMNLRYFLTFGMIGCGIGTGLLGVAYFANIHHFSYFISIQLFNGAMQSTGSPGTLATNANWFGKEGRGLVMGFWNSNTFLGNIIGTSIAAIWAQPGRDWGWSFIVPGFITIACAVVIFMFLVVDPRDVGLSPPRHHKKKKVSVSNPLFEGKDSSKSRKGSYSLSQLEKQIQLTDGNIEVSTDSQNQTSIELVGDEQSSTNTKDSDSDSAVSTDSTNLSDSDSFNYCDVKNSCAYGIFISNKKEGAIGILGALKIPGLLEFAMSFFFLKLVAYTFLFWLPFYVENTPIDGKHLSNEKANYLSTFFDVGGIIGGILAGLLSDVIKARGIVCVLMLYTAVPVLFVYRAFGGISIPLSSVLMIFSGFLVGGPYTLIKATVSNDLGTHKSLKNNQNAKATVSALLDGTGSIGAGLGPLLAGWILDNYSWDSIFYLLMASCFLSALLLSRVLIRECLKKYKDLKLWYAAKF